jgi:hypothetical protein
MEDLKSKAKVAFEHTRSLQEVFVTSDGEVFFKHTDAKLHTAERKLDDKEVTPFTRDQVFDMITWEAEEDLIPKIEAARSTDEVYQLVRSWTDPREAVIKIAHERMDEIKKSEGQ